MSDLPETSESLIARVKDPTDGVAWAEFLAIYRPVVYRLARSKGLQDSDAEDLAQRVFASISQAVGNWEPGADRPPFRAWLFQISRNAILNALSRKRPDHGAGSTSVWALLQAVPAEDSGDAAELNRESRREAFRWAGAQVRPEFSDATWRLFWETAVVGRSIEELAREAQCSAGAIYMARYRVMQRLKKKVQEATGEWAT